MLTIERATLLKIARGLGAFEALAEGALYRGAVVRMEEVRQPPTLEFIDGVAELAGTKRVHGENPALLIDREIHRRVVIVEGTETFLAGPQRLVRR